MQYFLRNLGILIALCCLMLIGYGCTSPDSDKQETSSVSHGGQKTLENTVVVKQGDDRKYNVFMIVSDALRKDALGCYGGEAKTPNIDKLAKDGALFKNAFSTSPWTVPSSVSMLTGNNPTTYSSSPFKESTQINVPDQELLVAESLMQLGYNTKRMVENPNARIHNNMQGLDAISYRQYHNFFDVYSKEQKDIVRSVIHEDLHDWETYKRMYVWIDEIMHLQDKDHFFFLHWFLDPHQPYAPVPEFAVSYDRTQMTKPEEIYQKPMPLDKPFTAQERRYNKRLYLAEVESVDKRVGMLVKALQASNKLKDTFIIFTADHGEQFGEHGKVGHGGFGKQTNYFNTLLNVPLIVVGPGINSKIIKEPVSLIGIMPTIKTLLGLDLSGTMQGKSFAGLIWGIDYSSQEPLYFSNVTKTSQKDALIDGDKKLICLADGKFKLFNWLSEPAELNDIAGQFPEIVKDMYAKIILIREKNKERLATNLQMGIGKLKLKAKAKKAVIKRLKELGYMK